MYTLCWYFANKDLHTYALMIYTRLHTVLKKGMFENDRN